MALDRVALLQASVWQGRTLEWSLLGALVVALALTLWHQARELQGQAEVAAVQSTLGAVRTNMALDHLRRKLARTAEAQGTKEPNPFIAMERLPANYAGLAGPNEISGIAQGSWVYDPLCICIGYVLADSTGLTQPAQAQTLWFKVIDSNGMMQLEAAQSYQWRNQIVR